MSRRPIRRLIAGCVLAGGLIYWYGSVRQPADLSRPLSLSTPPRLAVKSSAPLRIGVFNIHGCKGADGQRDVARVAACLNDLDLVALHEVRAGYASSQADDLGRLLNMAAVFAPTEWRWWRHDFGNGLLTNIELHGLHQIPLSVTSHTYRNALLTSFRYGDEVVQLLVVHVDLMQDRAHQLDEVAELFLSLRSPAILMGDLNADADHPGIRKLLAEPEVVNALATTPDNGRDWIMIKGLAAASAKIHRNHASDHPLIVAELVFDQSPESDSQASGLEKVKQAARLRNEH